MLYACAPCAAAASAALRADARFGARATLGSRRRRGSNASVRFPSSLVEVVDRFSATFQRHLGDARLGLR